MDTEIRVSTESRPWRRKFSRRSYRDLNPGLFSHESGALTTELSPSPDDKEFAVFHEELDRDVIRGKLSGLRDKSVQRRITNLSRNKTIEKVALHRC